VNRGEVEKPHVNDPEQSFRIKDPMLQKILSQFQWCTKEQATEEKLTSIMSHGSLGMTSTK
jgi:hypothetical protein